MSGLGCAHGHVSSCPEDRLCQVRLRGSGPEDAWQTIAGYACDAQGWRSPWRTRWNRRGYETRVVRSADAP